MTKKKDIINHQHKGLGLTRFSDSVENMIKNLLGQNSFVSYDILKNWSDIVGEDLASYSLPQKIDFKKDERHNGTLHLLVESGAFALEIGHQTPLILEKINTYFGYRAVEKIKIIQVDSSFFYKKEKNTADTEKKNLVNKDKESYIAHITDGMEDEELKARLQSLAVAFFSHKKEK